MGVTPDNFGVGSLDILLATSLLAFSLDTDLELLLEESLEGLFSSPALVFLSDILLNLKQLVRYRAEKLGLNRSTVY